MSDHLHSRTVDEVTTLTLDRPDQGNRLTNAMADALVAALRAAEKSRVVVLRASGPDFCLGRDMQPPPPGSRPRALDVLRDDAGPMLAMFDAFQHCPQPVIALVRGKAWGIGTVFSALCDLTLAAEGSSFRLGELERGIPPCIAMSPLLDRMPPKALAYLVYSAEALDAHTAQAAGIVSRVVAPEALEASAQALVDRLLSFPEAAVQAVKQFLGTAPHFNERHAALYGGSVLANVLASR